MENKIKQNTIGAGNKIEAKRELKQLSNISMLQEARNLSKATSNNQYQNRLTSNLKVDHHNFNNQDEYYHFGNFGREFSENINKIHTSPWTRSKTKIFSIDSLRYLREESDPSYKPSLFSECNQISADNYFGVPVNILRTISKNKVSNPLF